MDYISKYVNLLNEGKTDKEKNNEVITGRWPTSIADMCRNVLDKCTGLEQELNCGERGSSTGMMTNNDLALYLSGIASEFATIALDVKKTKDVKSTEPKNGSDPEELEGVGGDLESYMEEDTNNETSNDDKLKKHCKGSKKKKIDSESINRILKDFIEESRSSILNEADEDQVDEDEDNPSDEKKTGETENDSKSLNKDSGEEEVIDNHNDGNDNADETIICAISDEMAVEISSTMNELSAIVSLIVNNRGMTEETKAEFNRLFKKLGALSDVANASAE